MALHSEAKNALDKYAEDVSMIDGDEVMFHRGFMAPKAFAALNAILIACKSAEDNQKSIRVTNYSSPQVSVSGLRAIIARELG